MISFLLSLLLFLCPVAHAADVIPDEFYPDSTFTESFDGQKVQADISTNIFITSPSAPASSSASESYPVVAPSVETFISSLVQSAEAAPDTFKGLIVSIIGDYSPVQISSSGSDGSTILVVPSGVAGVDWPWIAGAVVFILCFYSLLRILGVLING